MISSEKNNFTADFDNQIGVISDKQHKKEYIIKFVETELLIPFKMSRLKDLNGTESNCFEHKLIFNYNYPEEESLPFYEDQMISARVIERDCEREYHLYSLKIYFDEKLIKVRTSVDEKWLSAKEYIKNYQKTIN